MSGSYDKSIKIFDLHNMQLINHFQGVHKSAISTIAITSDNRYIVSGSYDKSIKVFDLLNFKEIDRIQNAHEDSIFCLSLKN